MVDCIIIIIIIIKASYDCSYFLSYHFDYHQQQQNFFLSFSTFFSTLYYSSLPSHRYLSGAIIIFHTYRVGVISRSESVPLLQQFIIPTRAIQSVQTQITSQSIRTRTHSTSSNLRNPPCFILASSPSLALPPLIHRCHHHHHHPLPIQLSTEFIPSHNSASVRLGLDHLLDFFLSLVGNLLSTLLALSLAFPPIAPFFVPLFEESVLRTYSPHTVFPVRIQSSTVFSPLLFLDFDPPPSVTVFRSCVRAVPTGPTRPRHQANLILSCASLPCFDLRVALCLHQRDGSISYSIKPLSLSSSPLTSLHPTINHDPGFLLYLSSIPSNLARFKEELM